MRILLDWRSECQLARAGEAPTADDVAARINAVFIGRARARAVVADVGDERIEWWDGPEKNARWYRHRGCDEGDAPWLVPLDDCPPPTRADDECARCCMIFPLVARVAGCPDEGQRDALVHAEREGRAINAGVGVPGWAREAGLSIALQARAALGAVAASPDKPVKLKDLLFASGYTVRLEEDAPRGTVTFWTGADLDQPVSLPVEETK